MIDVAPIELEMETFYIRCTSPTVGYLNDMWCCIDPVLSPVRSCIKVFKLKELFRKLKAENEAISFISPKRDGRWFLEVDEEDGHLHWISTDKDDEHHNLSEIATFKLLPIANSKNSTAPSTVIAEKEDSKEQQIVRAVIRCEENGMFVRVTLDERRKEFYVFANEPDYFKGTEFIIEPR